MSESQPEVTPDEVLIIPGGLPDGDGGPDREAVEQPAKVMRIGSMIKQLLDEVRQAPLDEASRSRLREIYDTSVAEAQLVGWLEGLFHGIQATLFAQQMAARAQLEQMRQRSLPAASDERQPPGTYL
jgi:hypothetical protein